jgi:hypothetical protein
VGTGVSITATSKACVIGRPPRAIAKSPSGFWPSGCGRSPGGTYRAPVERVSFEGLAQAFLKDAEPNVRETTFKDYRGNLNRHLTPWFQGWKLLNIRRTDVEAFRAHLCDGGIGPRTVNKCLTLLGALFRYAMRHEWIEANPAEGTKLRASSRRSHDLVEANIFAPPEIQALLAATDPRWRVVILTAMLDTPRKKATTHRARPGLGDRGLEAGIGKN